MTFIRNTFLALIMLAGLAGGAYALSFKDIAGKWCGVSSNYNFSHNRLIVTFNNGSPTRNFKVTSYEFFDTKVTMHWLNEDKKLFTEFSEFSADGRTMAQMKNDVGPRRPFHRC